MKSGGAIEPRLVFQRRYAVLRHIWQFIIIIIYIWATKGLSNKSLNTHCRFRRLLGRLVSLHSRVAKLYHCATHAIEFIIVFPDRRSIIYLQ